jgi:hypothetical protein
MATAAVAEAGAVSRSSSLSVATTAAAVSASTPPAAPTAAGPTAAAVAAVDLEALVAAKVAAALAEMQAAAEARLAAEREAFERQKRQLEEEKAALQAALAAAAAAGAAPAAAVGACEEPRGGDGSSTPVNPSQKVFDPAAAGQPKEAGAATAAAGIHQLLPQVAAAAGVAAGVDGEELGAVGAVSPGALITPLPPPSQRSQLADFSPATGQPPVKSSVLVDLTGQTQDQELTAEAVRAWLEEQPEGATAPALLKHFVGCEQQKGGEGSSPGSSSKAAQLGQVLQQLVDDLEVMRVGRAAAASALVDLGDVTTLYTLV